MANQQHDEIEYNESEAIRYILSYLPKEDSSRLTDDDVQDVLDAIYDFYESEGLVQEDTTEGADIDEDVMFNFVRDQLQTMRSPLTDEQIRLILDGEFEYGKSIGIYEEEEED